jgi:hypothetical protein
LAIAFSTRAAARQRTAVEQRDDVGVVQRGKNLPLGAEPAGRVSIGQRRACDLDGDRMGKGTIGALGPVDDAHPAFADGSEHPIRSNQRASPDDGGIGRLASGVFARSTEETGRGIVRREQRLDLGAQLRLCGALLVQKCRPRGGRELGGCVEQGVNPRPELGRR